MEKMVHERKVIELALEFAASSHNSKVGDSSGQRQMVARVNIGQEEAAVLLEPYQAAPVTIQKFLEIR